MLVSILNIKGTRNLKHKYKLTNYEWKIYKLQILNIYAFVDKKPKDLNSVDWLYRQTY